jgi:hypothetical protein
LDTCPFSFFLFSTAQAFFCNEFFLRDSNITMEHLSLEQNGWMENIFGAHSQCRSRTFLGGSRWNGMLLHTSRVEAAYLGGVCVILILKA